MYNNGKSEELMKRCRYMILFLINWDIIRHTICFYNAYKYLIFSYGLLTLKYYIITFNYIHFELNYCYVSTLLFHMFII